VSFRPARNVADYLEPLSQSEIGDLPVLSHSFWHYGSIRTVATLAVLAFWGSALAQAGIVDIHPGADIPSVVEASPAGTTFVIYPGTYRLGSPIEPKNGDTFVGQTPCAPPKTACPAILSGSKIIGPLATFNGTDYEVAGQTQQGTVNVTSKQCEPGWAGCIYPEDLFFNSVPYKHLNSASLPTLSTGQWWFDYAHNVIYFHDNPTGHVVETSVVPSAFTGDANNVTVSQLTIEKFAVPVAGGAIGMPVGITSTTQGTNWKVENCEISLNHFAGLRMNYGMQILSNYIHTNGGLGITGGTNQSTPSGIVISGNTISYNNYAHVLPGFGAGGIKINGTKGIVVRGNTVANNDGAGIHFDTSSQSPLVDGNTVSDNVGGAGIQYEISLTSATFRNNRSLRNGAPDSAGVSSSGVGIGSYASAGVEAYCNVVEVSNASHENGIMVVASNRGYNTYPPGQYLMSTGNTFHHNTVVWDSGAVGAVAYLQSDVAHQPGFFADNTAPDFNTYHLPSLSLANFIYDNNNTQGNSRKTFVQYQDAGADLHGTADTNYKSGFPTVMITSPADQSSFATSVTVSASAADASGISKVEFFVDWSLQETVNSSPYNFKWTAGATGSHTVAAMAYSKAGISSCYAVTLNKQ
jgi:parallel beta-helix repeat protein